MFDRLLYPFRRKPGQSLRDHLGFLARRGPYASGPLAEDVRELLDRIEDLERRVAGLEARDR